MLITSMNSSVSSLEKCHCQQREMITQSEVPWEVIERDYILMPPRRGNEVYLSLLRLRRLFVITSNAVLITLKVSILR